MKNIINSIILIILLMSCINGNNDKSTTVDTESIKGNERTKELSDSMITLLQYGVMHNDTAKLNTALLLCDIILKQDQTPASRFNCYNNKCTALYALGRYDEAFDIQGELMMLQPEDNPQRNEFMIIKYIRKGDKDSTDYYIKKSLNFIDKSQEKCFNESLSCMKANIIYITNGKDAAISYLTSAIKDHHGSRLMVLEYYKNFLEQIGDTSDNEIASRSCASNEEFVKNMYNNLHKSYLKMQGK